MTVMTVTNGMLKPLSASMLMYTRIQNGNRLPIAITLMCIPMT